MLALTVKYSLTLEALNCPSLVLVGRRPGGGLFLCGSYPVGNCPVGSCPDTVFFLVRFFFANRHMRPLALFTNRHKSLTISPFMNGAFKSTFPLTLSRPLSHLCDGRSHSFRDHGRMFATKTKALFRLP